jgi:hypothetical protein
MKRHRHTPEQVVRKLAEGERILNGGGDLAAVLRTLEISEAKRQTIKAVRARCLRNSTLPSERRMGVCFGLAGARSMSSR